MIKGLICAGIVLLASVSGANANPNPAHHVVHNCMYQDHLGDCELTITHYQFALALPDGQTVKVKMVKDVENGPGYQHWLGSVDNEKVLIEFSQCQIRVVDKNDTQVIAWDEEYAESDPRWEMCNPEQAEQARLHQLLK